MGFRPDCPSDRGPTLLAAPYLYHRLTFFRPLGSGPARVYVPGLSIWLSHRAATLYMSISFPTVSLPGPSI